MGATVVTTLLLLTPTHPTLTPMCTATTVTMEERRGTLRPSLLLMLTPKLTHGCCTEDMGMVGRPTLPTHTLPTTTLSLISMEDAETTKELWSHVLADKQDMYLDSQITSYIATSVAI